MINKNEYIKNLTFIITPVLFEKCFLLKLFSFTLQCTYRVSEFQIKIVKLRNRKAEDKTKNL